MLVCFLKFVMPSPLASGAAAQVYLFTRIGGRVVDLLNGEHFDDILKDTPNELRPGGILLFFRSEDRACKEAFDVSKKFAISSCPFKVRHGLEFRLREYCRD